MLLYHNAITYYILWLKSLHVRLQLCAHECGLALQTGFMGFQYCNQVCLHVAEISAVKHIQACAVILETQS